MSFQVGDTVVKPGLGICKIKAVRKMQIDGKDTQFYVLQSGEVKVMVPFDHAHAGGLRPILDEAGIEHLFTSLREPIRIPNDEHESPEHYQVSIQRVKDELKQRDPASVATILKTLFYKSKICDLPKAETELLQTAMQTLSEEVAVVEHTTRQKSSHRIRSVLTEGRKSRKESLLNP